MTEPVTNEVLAERLSFIARDVIDIKVNTTALSTRVSVLEAGQLAQKVLSDSRKERGTALYKWTGFIITVTTGIAYLLITLLHH